MVLLEIVFYDCENSTMQKSSLFSGILNFSPGGIQTATMRTYFVRIFSNRGLRHASSTSVSTKSKRRGMKHLYLKALDPYTVLLLAATPTEFRV